MASGVAARAVGWDSADLVGPRGASLGRAVGAAPYPPALSYAQPSERDATAVARPCDAERTLRQAHAPTFAPRDGAMASFGDRERRPRRSPGAL